MRTNPIPLLLLAFSGCLCASDPGNLVPKTVAEDRELPALTLNGTRLHAEAFGEPGAPVIMAVHGGPGADYRSLLPLTALADDGYRVVLWDQRGAGLSQRHDPDTITLDVYLEDLRLVIEHYAPAQPVVFVGHSWGAMYLTAFIDKYGDYNGRIKGAILSDPGAFTDRQLREFIKRLQSSVSLVGEQFNDALWAGQFLSGANHERADYQLMLFAVRGAPSEHKDPDNLAPLWRSGAAVRDRLLELGEKGFDWTQNLAAFPHRVLFLRSELNDAATLAHQQELAASYPNADLITIPNVGHEMIWERPDEYLLHTRAYLQQIGVAP